MSEVIKPIFDRLMGKVISRKFTVFSLATLFLYLGSITGEQWVAISLGYIGIQGIADIATQWKFGKQ
mgnify:FL=1|jgi:hypothetical protein|tara:strand:+ start:3116 stop:3316 length:201 start_codon:yes stop_codon:yes gene_type:complete